MAKFRLTRPVWAGAARLPVGHVVEFKDEPTGVYRGRCEAVADESETKRPKASPPPPPASK